MSNSEIEQSGTVKGHLPNEASLSGRISNGLSLSGHISIGSGACDFIIKMTIEVNGDNYTVTSCDKTMEQIDAAVASGQNIKAIAFDKYVMQLVQTAYGDSYSYTFGAFLGSFLAIATVYKNPESGADDWEFYLASLTADIVEYSNAALPRISTVGGALDKLVPNSHAHTNKLVIDKFTETDGKPTYDGETLGSDFIIKMTVTSDDNGNYTVTSCDATVEQIDAAVANEKRVVLIATDTDNNLSWDIPIVQGFNGSNYYFATFLLGQAIVSFVEKVGENQARWQFIVRQIGSDFISYSNDALPNMSTVGEALDALVPKSHTHSNKSMLDKFAETDGKPTYDGKAIGGSGDFIIKMNVESNGRELIVTSCDTTVEQIDEAVAAEKRVVLIASIDSTILELPMIQGDRGYSYYFGAFLSESVIFSTVYKTENTSDWAFAMIKILAGAVSYSNDALPNVTDVEAALNNLVPNSHTHSNKAVLDKFAETDGKPTYNGEALGGGAGDFIIKMTVASDEDGYTVTSCDKTIEQIDAAVASGQNIKAVAFDKYILPLIQMEYGESYTFGAFLGTFLVAANAAKNPESGGDEWQFYLMPITADIVDYSNDALPNISTVGGALDKLVPNSHTHANKDVLDKLSVADGKLRYDGSDVGLKGDKGDPGTPGKTPVKGTDYWTAADKAEIVDDVLAALPTWTGGNY